jgi:hypothetical protein
MIVAGRPPNLSRGSYDGQAPTPVEMPPATWGTCRIPRCWVVGDLGDGLCVDHWDRGLGSRDKSPQKR